MKPRKKPHARDGQPFQLANPDLVHALDHPEKVHNSVPEDEKVHNSVPNERERENYTDVINSLSPLPSPQEMVHNLPALFGDPGNRETIRRNLKERGVTSINKLLRTFTAAELIEAISDFDRALDFGRRITNPEGYMRWLLK